MRRRTAIRYGTTLAVAFLAAVAGCAMPPLDRSVSPKPGPAADNPASQSAEGVKPPGTGDLVPIRARRSLTTTAQECAIRGGEYLAHHNVQPDDLVDCIFPARIRKLGPHTTYLAPREILASVYDYLYRSGIEKPRYGLYSYVLLPNPTPRSERLLAEIFATTSFVDLNQITIANINLMYIPVKSGKVPSLIPLVSDGSSPPQRRVLGPVL